MSGYIVERIGPERPIEPRASLALRIAREALRHAPQVCRYHGDKFDSAGYEYGPSTELPRCDSCKQPYRVTEALAAINRVLDGTHEAS